MAQISHYVMYNGSGKAVKCLTGKKAEKAQADINGITGYVLKSYTKETCPFCNVKPSEAPQEAEEGEEVQTVMNDTKTGQCRACGASRFKLKYVAHVMIRECRECGAELNLETLKTIPRSVKNG